MARMACMTTAPVSSLNPALETAHFPRGHTLELGVTTLGTFSGYRSW